MGVVSIKNINKYFGKLQVIKDFSLEISEKEFIVFVGPSGCGKSTLLRTIAGLEKFQEGEIHIAEKNVSNVDPANRGVAMVFQSYALYPHMTVEENMGFGLKMTGKPKEFVHAQVSRAAKILRLNELLHRKPKELSGGQRQRVAIGRAIVRDPKIFLFDEPLSNLDAELRVQMRVEIAKLHEELNATMIYVTHDQVEAMTLADRIVVLRSGIVEQIGKPLELYDNPANMFVAGFIGSPQMNFLHAKLKKIDSNSFTLFIDSANKSFDFPIKQEYKENLKNNSAGSVVRVGIRPEHFISESKGIKKIVNLSLKTEVIEHLGGSSFIYSKSKSGESVVIGEQDHHVAEKKKTFDAGFNIDSAFVFGEDEKRLY